MMKLLWLRSMAEVARSGSFTQASLALGLAQPTVSTHIAQLEAYVGATLFVRSTRTLGLTEIGTRLLPAIHDVLAAEGRLKEAVSDLQAPRAAILRIGASPLVHSAILHERTASYPLDRPHVSLVFKECFVSDLDDRLMKGTIDLAVGILLPKRPGRDRTTLYKETLHYLPPGGPTGRKTVPLAEVVENTLLMPVDACGLATAIDALTAGHDVQVYGGRALSYDVLAEWSQLGLGGAILPTAKLPHPNYPVILDASGEPAEVNHQIVWQREHRRRAHIGDAIEQLSGR